MKNYIDAHLKIIYYPNSSVFIYYRSLQHSAAFFYFFKNLSLYLNIGVMHNNLEQWFSNLFCHRALLKTYPAYGPQIFTVDPN